MSRSLKLRTFGVFLLALVFILPSAEAAPQRATGDRTITEALWSLFTAAWTKAGCILDPNGRTGCARPPGVDKAGCIIDPDGAAGPTCATPPQTTENGCIIDPNGSCVASLGSLIRD